MRILVTGANGFIGSHLVADFLDAGHQVIGAVRNPSMFAARFPQATALGCDFNLDTDPAHWLPRLAGIDAVVNCAGVMQHTRTQDLWAIHARAPIALFDACDRAGVRRVVQISAISIDAQTDYARSKRAADEHLMALDLDWVVLRPSLVYAEGSYGGTSVLRALASMPWFLPVVGSGEQPFSPLHARDLARVVRASVEEPALTRRAIDVVGPERLTQLEVLRKLRRWLGLDAAPALKVPLRLARIAARIGDVIGTVSMNSNAVEQLEHGNAGDPAPLLAAVGWMPEPMDAVLARSPAQAQDRLHARMQLLRLPVTLALAAVWIGSGIAGLHAGALFVADAGKAFGIHGDAAHALAASMSVVDIAIGVLVLLRWRVTTVALVQFAVVFGYTLVLGAAIPGLWVDPYGALLKNLPILALIPVWALLETERA